MFNFYYSVFSIIRNSVIILLRVVFIPYIVAISFCAFKVISIDISTKIFGECDNKNVIVFIYISAVLILLNYLFSEDNKRSIEECYNSIKASFKIFLSYVPVLILTTVVCIVIYNLVEDSNNKSDNNNSSSLISQVNEQEIEESQEESQEESMEYEYLNVNNKESLYDGSYCADITYYNPNTGTDSDYRLLVDVSNNFIEKIHFSDGWFDNSDFVSLELNEYGQVSFNDKSGYEYEVQIIGESSSCFVNLPPLVNCKGLTLEGKPCQRRTDNPNGFCWQHQDQE